MGGALVAFCMVPDLIGGLLAQRRRKFEKDAVRQSRTPFIVARVPLFVVTAICIESPSGARHKRAPYPSDFS